MLVSSSHHATDIRGQQFTRAGIAPTRQDEHGPVHRAQVHQTLQQLQWLRGAYLHPVRRTGAPSGTREKAADPRRARPGTVGSFPAGAWPDGVGNLEGAAMAGPENLAGLGDPDSGPGARGHGRSPAGR